MSLSIIGVGLGSIRDITLRGLELAQEADEVYLEHYTSSFSSTPEEIGHLLKKTVKLAFREDLEQKSGEMIEKAKHKRVALLVVGDAFSATTHIALFLDAKKAGVHVDIVHNASVMTAVGMIGLELYKYGKTTSLPFPNKGPAKTPYSVIRQNKEMGFHTLCLLDLDLDDPVRKRYMTVPVGLQLILDEEKTQKENVLSEQTIVVGAARLGQSDAFIRAGTVKELMMTDFGAPLQSIVIPGKLHFVEEEALEMWKAD